MKSALAVALVAPLVVLFWVGAIVLGVALCVPALYTAFGWGFDASGSLVQLSRGGAWSWIVCGALAIAGLSLLGWMADKFSDAWAALRGHAKAAGGPIAH